MLLKDVLKNFNEHLAGERHSFQEIVMFLDKAVDDINAQLNSTFPVFSELPEGSQEYNYFPDRYIRTVVCVGAAWYYFTTDEEGISTAPQYMQDYDRGLFMMVRDYFNSVPEEYQDQGTKALPLNLDNGMAESEERMHVDSKYIIP